MSHGTEEPKVELMQEVVIAVDSKNMEQAVALYEDLFGLKFDLEWAIPNENIHVRAAKLGETQLQIVESTSPEGVLAKFIQSRGEGLNHIAFKVANLQKMVAKLKGKGIKLIPEEPVTIPKSTAPVSMGSYIFIHPKSTHGVLIELIEFES